MKIKKLFTILMITLLAVTCLCGCHKETAKINLPENISLTGENPTPVLNFYDINTKSITKLDLEEYLKGVLAGEMFNDWSIEALKAQAILARTFTLRFLQNSSSKYSGADISNDISEAQAYDASKINQNIINAVNETRGKVVLSDDELIEAWFHSNSGGKTTIAKTGLNYLDDEDYTQVTHSPETEDNSENFSWTQTFTKSEILSTLREMGVSVSSLTSFSVGEKDASGRAITLRIGEIEFSANTFRMKIGSTKMKSTLINDIVVSSNSISLSGNGYGHGVGMSQWGAKILAEEGKTAEEIINYYFKNIKICPAEYN